ncbi:MAG: AraC family transcriptional regulator [Alphaproteobacteria bacterium]|nr:MAG: AraC family transcriptional regulator [Alphaproteobacteria bacterium]
MWWPENPYEELKPGAMPLGRYSAFRSSDLDEAREFVGSIFCPHRLEVSIPRKSADVRMNHAPAAGVSLNYLQYGAPVNIVPGELGHFFLVQVQLKGGTMVRCGSRTAEIGPAHASVLSPTEYTDMHWTEDAAELIVRLERDAVERQLSALLGQHLPEPIVFDLAMSCETGPAGSWWRAVRFLAAELELSENVLSSPLAVKQFEQTLICSLLYSQPHNYTEALKHGLSTAAPRHVKRVEEYIHAHAQDPITIEDLTEVAGVSARTLFAGFKRFRGTSPMKYLRDVRLKRVRQDLERAGDNETVTDIAMRWGFGQLGRFAVEYKKEFGESPSETLRRRLLV